jgi:hypothetical protein
VGQRRPRLLAARHQPPQRSGDLALPALEVFASKPDSRTEEQYTDQVETYLSQARDVLIDRALWKLFRHLPALLRLQASNPTDLGYTGVRITVHVSGQVTSYPQELLDTLEDDQPEVPLPPDPLGTPTVSNLSQIGAGIRLRVAHPDAGFSRSRPHLHRA